MPRSGWRLTGSRDATRLGPVLRLLRLRMRKGPPSLRRAVAGSALLVWSALAGVLPAADAAAERASEGARAHVEAVGGSATCTPVHDQLACQLCRVLRLAGKSADAGPQIAVRQAPCPVVERAALVVGAVYVRADNLSRAPPSVA